MIPNIIGLVGKAGSGKNTVASMINKITGNRYTEVAFADKLKQVAGLMLGVPAYDFENREYKNSTLGPEWDYMSVREFLQRIGTDAVRNGLHVNTWVNLLFKDYYPGDNWIVTDVRMNNEANRIKHHGGILVKITKPNMETGNHQSETELDTIQADYTIINDGSFFDLEFSINKMLDYYANN